MLCVNTYICHGECFFRAPEQVTSSIYGRVELLKCHADLSGCSLHTTATCVLVLVTTNNSSFFSFCLGEAQQCQVRFRPYCVWVEKAMNECFGHVFFKSSNMYTMIFYWEDCPVKMKSVFMVASIQSRGGSVDTSPRQRHRHSAPHRWARPDGLHCQ